MLPAKVSSPVLASKVDLEDKPSKLTKAKKRRLRKRRLIQGPQIDGGEAQAELPPDTELELIPAATVLGDAEEKEPAIFASITITPLITSISTKTEAKEDSIPIIPVSSINEVQKTENLESDKCIVQSSAGNTELRESTQEKSLLQIEQPKITLQPTEMSDKQGRKTPQKGKPTKQEQSKSPNVSSNPNKPSVVTEKVKTDSQPQSSPKPKETSVKETAMAAQQESSAEKTREEIMAERKAKKAEKAAKKGKGGKENSKPQKEETLVNEVVISAEAPIVEPQSSPAAIPPAATAKGVESPASKLEEKSKATLKEERRLKQEAQRAAKATAGGNKKQEPQQSSKPEAKKASKETPITSSSTLTTKPKSTKSSKTNLAKLLNHLQRDSTTQPSSEGIHPAIIKLGLQYSQHQVAGSNARAVALMRAMKKVIEDYVTPPQSELRRDLENCMQVYMEYLDKCRPVSVSMTSAMSYLKNCIQQLPPAISDEEAKKLLVAGIENSDREDGFINKLDLDCCSVSFNMVEKIKDGDVILTYGCSSLVQRVLLEAKRRDKKFRVMVVGARPWKEAEKMLHCLSSQGLPCTYLLINAVSSIMRQVSKVLLGAHAILANGYVQARAGSSQVALIAHSLNVPVIVCCETYKFCDRVQTDAFVHNELGESDQLVPGLKMNNLTQCVLAYDVTPPELVSAVVTEVSMLPCSSVPVVLHMQSSETRLKRRNIVGPSRA